MPSKFLRNAVIRLLEDKHSTLNVKVDPENDRFVTIQPVWTDFGPVEIFEEHEELVVYWGQFTHNHIDSYNEDPKEKINEVLNAFDRLLTNVVADKVAFWKQARGGSGGFFFVDDKDSRTGTQKAYLWSGAVVYCSTGAQDLSDVDYGNKTISLEGVDVDLLVSELESTSLMPDTKTASKPWWKFW